MKRQLTMARNMRCRIVYVDETSVTRKTVPQLLWARKNENLRLDQEKLQEPSLALLAGISKEKGVEHNQIFNYSVNIERFIDYLQGLRSANEGEQICIFMDNLGVHVSEDTKKEMRRLQFR